MKLWNAKKGPWPFCEVCNVRRAAIVRLSTPERVGGKWVCEACLNPPLVPSLGRHLIQTNFCGFGEVTVTAPLEAEY